MTVWSDSRCEGPPVTIAEMLFDAMGIRVWRHKTGYVRTLQSERHPGGHGWKLDPPPHMVPPWSLKTVAGSADDGQLDDHAGKRQKQIHIKRKMDNELRERVKRRHREAGV